MKKRSSSPPKQLGDRSANRRQSHPPPPRQLSGSETQSRLLGGTSVAQVYVINLETARRLGDLDSHVCWADDSSASPEGDKTI